MAAKEVVVRLPVELWERLTERAKQDDRSKAATIRVALREYINGPS